MTFKGKSPWLAKNDCLLQDSKPPNDKTSEKGSDGSTLLTLLPARVLLHFPFCPPRSCTEQTTATALSLQALLIQQLSSTN